MNSPRIRRELAIGNSFDVDLTYVQLIFPGATAAIPGRSGEFLLKLANAWISRWDVSNWEVCLHFPTSSSARHFY